MLEILTYTLAIFGGLLILAIYQDTNTRAANKKAGTPNTSPSLLTLFSGSLAAFMHEVTKPKKPKAEPKPGAAPK